MTQLQQALTRALSDPLVHRSFATLDKHAASGTFDTQRAIALLRNNARDHTRHTPSSVRNALADMLYSEWSKRAGIDTPGTLRYIKRHGI